LALGQDRVSDKLPFETAISLVSDFTLWVEQPLQMSSSGTNTANVI